MLKKAKEVIGLKVITVDDGKVISSVKDVIYDPEQNKVRGLLIDEGGWFSDAKFILTEDVNNIGPDAVMVQNAETVKKASEIEGKVSNIAEEGHYLTRTKVVTEEGKELGQISDIYFDTQTGNVEEFEVSQGLVKDVASGKKRFKIDDIKTVGEQATIVSGFTEVVFDEQEQEQGVVGAMNQAKDKASDAMETIKDKSSELVETVEEKTKEGVDKAQEFANSPEVEEKKEQMMEKVGGLKDSAQQKMDEAKVKAALGKSELEDKSGEMKEKIQKEDVVGTVKEQVSNIKDTAGEKLQDAKSIASDATQSLKDEAKDAQKKRQ